MNLLVSKSKCKGKINIPSSKSEMHRVIFAACLANGKSVIENVTLSNDIKATINAFKALGALIHYEDEVLTIQGIKDFKTVISKEINCKESGSTLRFIIPLLGMFDFGFTLKGAKYLFSRPLDIYKNIYKDQNLIFDLKEDSLYVKGKITAKEYIIPGNISSQFISGFLFMLPLLDKDSRIKIINNFESKSYVDLTIKILKIFGIEIEVISINEFFIKGNQKYKPTNYYVENDYSQFAFYAVLGAINNDITCKGLNFNSLQGDKEILNILDSFKVKYEIKEDTIIIHKSKKLQGESIDLTNCVDLGPISMVLSLFNSKPVVIQNTYRLKIKESDRVDAMVTNLRKLNAKIDVYDNKMIIYPSKLKNTKEVLNPFNDHRIMMSLVVLASCIKGTTRISNPECVKKSYVNFYKDISSLGIEVGLSDK